VAQGRARRAPLPAVFNERAGSANERGHEHHRPRAPPSPSRDARGHFDVPSIRERSRCRSNEPRPAAVERQCRDVDSTRRLLTTCSNAVIVSPQSPARGTTPCLRERGQQLHDLDPPRQIEERVKSASMPSNDYCCAA
jgi:hypothetical protein